MWNHSSEWCPRFSLLCSFSALSGCIILYCGFVSSEWGLQGLWLSSRRASFHLHTPNCFSNLFFQPLSKQSHIHEILTSTLTHKQNQQKKGLYADCAQSQLWFPHCLGLPQLSSAAVWATCRGQRPSRRGPVSMSLSLSLSQWSYRLY